MNRSHDSPATLVRWVDRYLNDAVLGFLALISLFLGLVPSIFIVTPEILDVIGAVEFGIVVLFGIEYGTGLASASSRSAYIRNPWRILDAMIIIAGTLSLIPAVNNLFRNTPALRLIRFSRLALFGTRTGTALTPRQSDAEAKPEPSKIPLESYALISEPKHRFDAVPWSVVLRRIDSSEDDWLVVSNFSEDQLQRIADALGVPDAILRNRLYDSTFPRVDRMECYTTLFVWYPSIHESAGQPIPTVSRIAILLVGSMQNVVVLTRHAELTDDIIRHIDDADPAVPRLLQATHALLKGVLRRYNRINEQLEMALIRIEMEQAILNDKTFLDRTFRLRSEITRVRSSLKHLADVLGRLAEQPVAIKGFEVIPRPSFAVLADDAGNLYESVSDLMLTLGALVDLRLNVSSFQMNKVMRLLAVLTALTIIPAVTGGLLGMNIGGNPWPATLQQVSFGVAAGMALCLYIFAVKGWLR